MQWISKGISLISTTSAPNLQFSIGELISPPSPDFLWAIHTGIKKADQSKISVFIFDISKQKTQLNLAQNFLKKFRTIRNPLLPKYIDGIETESQIIFGTEVLKPLAIQLENNLDNDYICLGLFKIASLIKFLNVDCSFIHCNIRLSSIFTTKAGEWKLLGYEILSPHNKEDNNAVVRFASLLSNSLKYAPPEIQKSGSWAMVGNYPVGAIDTWQFGVLIHEIFNGPFQRAEEIGPCGKIPVALASVYKQFINHNPSARSSQIPQLLAREQGYFDNEIIRISSFLDMWNIKEANEKDRFILKISGSLDSFPKEFQKYKILPELLSALEFGGASSKALTPILKIGAALDHAEFEMLISPIIIKLFALPDRAIRLTLFENLPHIIDHLSKKIVSDQIYPNLATGFSDTSPPIREETLKSILVIIPKLSDNIINNDLLRCLAKLQMDEEPGIRTNTTICIGKISKSFSNTTKNKVLLPAFSRSLLDPFPPARNAGLLALSATLDNYTLSDICSRIIPVISPLLADSEGLIRAQAMRNLELFLKRVALLSKDMPDTILQRNMLNAPSQPSSSGAGSAPASYMGWAISAVSSKITESVGLISTSSSPAPSLSKISDAVAIVKDVDSKMGLNVGIPVKSVEVLRVPNVLSLPKTTLDSQGKNDGWGMDELEPQPSLDLGVGRDVWNSVGSTDGFSDWGPAATHIEPQALLADGWGNEWDDPEGGGGAAFEGLTVHSKVKALDADRDADKKRRKAKIEEMREARRKERGSVGRL